MSVSGNTDDNDFIAYYNKLQTQRYFSTSSPYDKTTISPTANINATATKIKKVNYASASNHSHPSPSSIILAPLPSDIVSLQHKKFLTEEKNVKLSNQIWLPHQLRVKQAERKIRELQQSIKHIKATRSKSLSSIADMSISQEYIRMKAQASLGMVNKESCDCCGLEYLPLNLPYRVPRKAITDVRRIWKQEKFDRSQSSADINTLKATSSHSHQIDSSGVSLDSTSTLKMSTKDMTTESMSRAHNSGTRDVITQYDICHICRFCSQYFQHPDEYRPSLQTELVQSRLQAEEKMRQQQELKWDPLLALELDRANNNNDYS